MSDAEEEEFNFFGTPLESYDEASFPSKRPISIEEQVARDAQGRRRFHGAFTGGFSAGFYNTVGSLEGWKPQEFISSRNQKAQNVAQRPEDFMDDEDVGEFGIAPQVVKATGDYSNTKKRKKPVVHDGPIPGEPVLEGVLQAGNETVGYFLMKNINAKGRQKEKNQLEPKVYGCVMPKELPPEEDYKDVQYELHEIYKQYLSTPKGNSFGIGYIGLDKSEQALRKPTNLTLLERNNKKLSISGQAFGVGAFEDEDDDIYMKDDMSKYDFELTSEAAKKQSKPESGKIILDIFVSSTKTSGNKNIFPPPVIPASFTGKYKQKKSRFAPVAEENVLPERKSMDASFRAKYLGESQAEQTFTPSNTQHVKAKVRETEKPKATERESSKSVEKEKPKEVFSPFPGLVFDRFVAAEQEDNCTNILKEVKPTETPHGTREMHDAVKLKMFGPLTHVTISWQPCSFLCKRFNVPEPNMELQQQKNRKRTKNLIFEYQKHSESSSIHKPGLTVTSTAGSIQEEAKKEEVIEDAPTTSTIANLPTSDSTEMPSVSSQPTQEEKGEADKIEVAESVSSTLDIVTDRVDVAKNIDLFKAVFLSSSESESEDVENDKEEVKKRNEMLTTKVLTETLIAEIPEIKIKKQGILSNLDFSKISASRVRINVEEALEHMKEPEKVIDDNSYGPKLPTNIVTSQPVIVKDVINEDEWVEKDSSEAKHKKKHKKEKHKKHKHKHKSKK